MGAVGLCRNEPNQLMAMCVACGRIVCGDISFTDVLKPDETGYAPVNLVILTVGNGPGELWWWASPAGPRAVLLTWQGGVRARVVVDAVRRATETAARLLLIFKLLHCIFADLSERGVRARCRGLRAMLVNRHALC